MSKPVQNFTQGGILGPLLRFAGPVLLSLMLQALYGAVDMMVVGQFSDAANVSAVATGSQLMNSTTFVITSLAMGVTVLVGQKIGEGDPALAGRIIGSSICLFAAVGAVVSVLLFAGGPFMLDVLNTPAEALSFAKSYVYICAAGEVFIVAYNVLGSVFRGIGDAKMPLIAVAIAAVINVAGDLLFVAVFGMGAAGAALATVLAQAISVVISFAVIRRRTLPFAFTRRDIRWDGKHIRAVLRLGIPVALQELLVSTSFMVITAIVNDMGVMYSAGVGVAEKLCSFVMLVPSAFSQSMSAFVAQNIGAGQKRRAQKALACGIGASLAVGVCMFGLAFFRGDLLAGVFAKDPAIIAQAADYLKAYAIDCLFTSFLFCWTGYFNGCGKTLFVMLQGICGAFCVRVPVAFLVSRMAGVTLFHIGLATPASTLVQILLCAGYMLLLERADKNQKPLIRR